VFALIPDLVGLLVEVVTEIGELLLGEGRSGSVVAI
jgi:hypothetical protein